MATVDVIIPAYNAAKFLPFALDSVAAQDFGDWCIVLVDDGSTDNTPDVVAPYLNRFGSKMKYVRQENRGLPAARNTAIRSSDSEFIAILDADDVWLPFRLTESIKSFKSDSEVGLSYGLITRIDENGGLLDTFAGNQNSAHGKIAPSIYKRKVELPCPTVTFRRQCIEDVGLFDESMRATEDRDLWLRIALRYKVAAIPKVIAYYRTSASSMSRDLNRMLAAQLYFINKHYGAPGCGFAARQIATARAYKQRAEGLLDRNQFGHALRDSLHACLLWPGTDNVRTAASLLLKLITGRAS